MLTTLKVIKVKFCSVCMDTEMCDVVAFSQGHTMVLHEFGIPVVNYYLTQSSVLVIMDNRLNV